MDNCQHKLYKELSHIYDTIYEGLFDYDKVAKFIDERLKKIKARKVLEVGCGTGSLTKILSDMGYEVTGLDKSEEMLDIARSKVDADFVRCDMREIDFDGKFDAVVCLGRSFTYMLSNSDAIKALRCFRRAVKEGGLMILDNFSASFILTNFKLNSQHFSVKDGVRITKINNNELELSENVRFRWRCTYIVDSGDKLKMVNDDTVLRAFFSDEMRTLA